MCFVYECRAAGWPREEPSHPDYQGMWVEGGYCYFFFNTPQDDFFRQWLRKNPKLRLVNFYSFHPSRWQTFSTAIVVAGLKIVTVAPPKASPASPDIIYLKKGTSFGSGLHPTTKGCIVALRHAFSTSVPSVVLDCGTGSGILAIVAAKLGAKLVIASDINPLALRELKENANINRVKNKIKSAIGDGLSCFELQKVDLAVMNLEWPSLNSILRNQPWQKCKQLIISGFPAYLQSVVKGLTRKSHYTEKDFTIENWKTLLLRSKES